MAGSLSSNDDDLFEYDPETSESSSTNTFAETTTGIGKSDLYDNIKTDLDPEFDSSSGNIHHAKAKLAVSYQHALNFFIKDVAKESLAKSLHIVLDKLTNGDFSLISLFYETEMKISRKMLFINMYHGAFSEQGTDTFKEVVGKIIGIDFTPIYTETCYQSASNITMHTLVLDRALYLTLSNHLGIPVNQALFQDPYELNSSEHTVYLEDYKKELSDSLTNTIMGFGLLEKIQELTNQPTICSFGNVE